MINLTDYGYNDIYERQITEEEKGAGLQPARVLSVQKETYQLISSAGENNAKLKGSIFYQDSKYQTYPAVGDFVLIKPNPIGDDVIYRVLERRTSFSRLNPTLRNNVTSASEQIVAANFDYVFIMASLNYDFNVRRIERYLTTAWQSGGSPVILLTKADLCEDYSDMVAEIESVAPGMEIHVISTYTGLGMDALNKYMKPAATLVFLGSSGIGKSSLVNALAGEELMKVNIIREDDSKGHHTTTYRQLFKLNNGVLIIDTPGMRELGIWAADEGIGETFSDIEELASQCKFNDCSHTREPGCAIKAALEDGTLTQERFKSYIKLRKEAQHSANKAAYLKAKTQFFKNAAKNQHASRKY
ncbi:ribosome small subunit-dependent GTPase A [Anaerocolumna sedimenticola]|uniref:Small ribosomal subunit biogenesis GTPase RsgA n=1 Tax=Anaerocolumna sedimenticola TaxID=2696063 RepID=A0A6P1TRM2_9FIRM|nr:ribosome small subunit-dependent GTPase A [Anaerocolumna sedimenticola]QHQ62997.1 ribosome small subunit-dependent GTPase A [Anaerocolumna sedimenticola]